MSDILGRFGAVILCDDIRREITNKDIIIGAYGGEVIVQTFPAQMTFALYIEYFPNHQGEQKIFLKLNLLGAGSALITVALDVKSNEPVILSLPGVRMQFPHEGELDISASVDQVVWSTIKHKKIVQGEVQSTYASARSSATLNDH